MHVYGMSLFKKKFCTCIGKSFLLDNSSYVTTAAASLFYHIF